MASGRISMEEWEKKKNEILTLAFDKTVDEVVWIMKQRGFAASKSQFESRLKIWNACKNLKSQDWVIVLGKIDELESQGKRCRVLISGRKIPESRIKRARRYIKSAVSAQGPVNIQNVSIETYEEDEGWTASVDFSKSVEVNHSNGEDEPSIIRGVLHPQELCLDAIKSSDTIKASDPTSQVHLAQQVFNSPLQITWSQIDLGSSFLQDEVDLDTALDSNVMDSLERWSPQLRPASRNRHTSLTSHFIAQSPSEFPFRLGLGDQSSEIIFAPSELGRILQDLPSNRLIGNLEMQGSVFSGSMCHKPSATDVELFVHNIGTSRFGVNYPQNDMCHDYTSRIMSAIRNRLHKPVPPCTQGSSSSLIGQAEILDVDFDRLLLSSIINGFAGLDEIPIGPVLQYLSRHGSSGSLLKHLLQGGRVYATRSLAEKIFKASIENDDSSMLVHLLRMHRLDINGIVFVDYDGKYTPIEYAAKSAYPEVIQVLLSAGADMNKSFNDGMVGNALGCLLKSFDYRTHFGRALECISALLQAGGSVDLETTRDCLERFGGIDLEWASLFEKLSPLLITPCHSTFISKDMLWYMANRMPDEEATSAFERIFLVCQQKGCGKCLTLHASKFQWSLVEGAKRGHIQLVRLLLPYSTSLSQVLSASIAGQNRTVIEEVLSQHPDMNPPPHPISPGLIEDSYELDFENIALLTTPLTEAILAKDLDLICQLERGGAFDTLGHGGRLEPTISAAVASEDLSTFRRIMDLCPYPNPKELSRALIQSVILENKFIFKMLLDSGADVNKEIYLDTDDFYEVSPLQAALEMQNKEILYMILNADIGYPSDIRSVLEDALKWGSIEILEKLRTVYLGSAVSGFRSIGTISRTLASMWKDNLSLFKYLLNSGMPSTAQLSAWLEVAVHDKDISLLLQLLKRGADPFHPDSKALALAARMSPGLLRYLLEHIPQRHCDKSNLSTFRAFEVVISSDPVDLDCVDSVLKSKYVNINKFVEQSPFKQVTYLGLVLGKRFHNQKAKLAVVEKLLRAGSKPNSAVRRVSTHPIVNHTALLEAIEADSESLVALLLSCDARVNEPAEFGIKRTPLQKAAEMGNLDIVKLLLDAGADVNAEPAYSSGATAIQLAASSGNCTVAALLLSHGANLMAPPSQRNGRWPIEGAAEYGRVDMIEFLWKVSGTGFPDEQCRRAMKLAEANGHLACRDFVAELSASSLLSV